MAKNVTAPKTYQPPGGRAKEHLRYISEAEERLIKRATDGKSNMTEHGVPSLYMEASDSGKLKDSKPSQSKTSSYNGSSNEKGGAQPGGPTTSQNSEGRYGGSNSKADIAARNAADVAKQAAAVRASSKVSTPFASGSPLNNPVNINPFDNLRNAVAQKQAVRAIMGTPSQTPPAAPMGGAPDPRYNVGVMDAPRLAADPTNGLGRLAAPQAPVKDQSRLPQGAPRGPDYGEALQNALAEQQAAIKALNAARANPDYANLNGQPPNPNSPANMTPEQQAARLAAITRGPGAVAGVMPGASPLSQDRTLQTLANAMTEGGRPVTKEDLGRLARTVAGESANQPPMGQTAVANTMVNRMALAAEDPKKYGYMGGANVDKLMQQYDATGMAKRTGGIPNSAFKNAVPGTDAFGQGIASLAGAVAPNSQFNQTAPANVREATSFYNPKVSNPKWGGPQFSALGDHVFGLPDELAKNGGAAVAAARAMPGGPVPGGGAPVQTASISPAAAPPGGLGMLAQSGVNLAQALPGAKIPNFLGPINNAAGLIKQFADAHKGFGSSLTGPIADTIVSKEAKKAVAQAEKAIKSFQNGTLSKVAAAEAVQKAQAQVGNAPMGGAGLAPGVQTASYAPQAPAAAPGPQQTALGRLSEMFNDASPGAFGPGGGDRGGNGGAGAGAGRRPETKRGPDGELLYKDPETGQWTAERPERDGRWRLGASGKPRGEASKTASASTTSFLRKPLPPWVAPELINPAAPAWNRPWNA